MGTALLTILVTVHVTFWVAWKKDKFSVMDITWGLGPVLVALACYLRNYSSGPKVLLLAMVAMWGLRLAGYIFVRSRNAPEDPRYMAYREKWGANYLSEGYKKVFLAQGAAMFLVTLPVQLGMSSELERFGVKQLLGAGLFFVGFALESWADLHLYRFKQDPAMKGKLCTSGPWRFVRFPNYLGEMIIWWGLYLYILNFWTAWAILGPITITYSLFKVTGIPLIEERYLQRPEYREYAARVPRLLPLFGKRIRLS